VTRLTSVRRLSRYIYSGILKQSFAQLLRDFSVEDPDEYTAICRDSSTSALDNDAFGTLHRRILPATLSSTKLSANLSPPTPSKIIRS